MILTSDIRKVWRMGRSSRSDREIAPKQFPEKENTKARHVLGLDSTSIRTAGQINSARSISSIKPRAVTFSDATTVAFSSRSITDYSNEGERSLDLRSKSSSVLKKRSRQGDLQGELIQPKLSTTSLRSFYDKSQAPMSVSQQTSDSSSRDFALRRGVPSVLSNSSQEKEHVKQLRLFTRTSNRPNAKSDKQTTPVSTISRHSRTDSVASSIQEISSNTGQSLSSQPSNSRISITRSLIPTVTNSPVPVKRRPNRRDPSSLARPVSYPAQAKMNVRRPKVGAKNWFDSIDSDSSEGEGDRDRLDIEAINTAGIGNGVTIEKVCSSSFPPRSSSITPTQQSMTLVRDGPLDTQQKLRELLELADKLDRPVSRSEGLLNPLDAANLLTQSVLWLSSSEDEADYDVHREKSHDGEETKLRDSLLDASWDDSHVVLGKAVTVDAKSPAAMLHNVTKGNLSVKVPGRTSSRLGTYLSDDSTSMLTQQNDLITSFPSTPVDRPSRPPSVRESMLSEAESVVSTKLMTVTRQEESLIAAMRMKKVAMRKARALNNHRDALRVLEINGDRPRHVPTRVASLSQLPVEEPLTCHPTLTEQPSDTSLGVLLTPRAAPRHDSVTTIQTDSMQGHSTRSSIATYMSEGSDDLQLPYSALHGLPMGSTILGRSKGRYHRSKRDTFLSEVTVDSTISPSISEWSPSVRDSHVVMLDPIERQIQREEIPSQLFLESPYVGWGLQTAQ